MILTRYAMGSFEFREQFFDLPPFSPPGLFRALADAFGGVGTGRDVEQAPIGFRILHDYLSFCPSR